MKKEPKDRLEKKKHRRVWKKEVNGPRNLGGSVKTKSDFFA